MNTNDSPSASRLSPQQSGPSKRSWLTWLTWLATEDHCEWANRYVYWLKTPLGVLVLCALFSLLCGLFVAPQVFVLLVVILAVVAVGYAWPGIAVRGLNCRLVFSASRGREGKPTAAKLIVTNRWPWPVWGLAVDDPAFARATGALATGQTSDADATPVALSRIDGWSRNSYDWTFIPPLRGVYPSSEVRVVTGFPFGLRTAARAVEVERTLTVWPETFWLPPLQQHQSRRDWAGELSESMVGTDGTRLGVRDYRQGDSLRDVHWAKSARHERLIVSEREASIVEDYKVVVDVDPENHSGSGSNSTLEWALKIAASICESVCSSRGRVELWLGSERISTGAGGEQLAELLDSIAKFDALSPSRESANRTKRSAQHTHIISVGTEASVGLNGRSIVLRRDALAGCKENQEDVSSGWINIESSDDVPGQVLRGWRATTRSVRIVK